MVMIPEVALSSGARPMPLIGMGTANFPLDAEATKRAVVDAVELGYRHFDTASLYQSEEPLGEAIAEALRRGLIKSRGELFITSKLWCNDAHPDRVLPAIRRSLGNLQLDYLDLYLIHWPMSIKPGTPMFPIDKKDILPLDLKPVWEAMEECQRLGLARSIGVSNFTRKKLEELLATAKIPPTVNQVEMNPVWKQNKLREFCKEKGIHVTAYSPLGGQHSPGSKNPVLGSEVLKKIAEAKGKTVAQVCLRWIYEQGASMVMKTFNKDRLKWNIEIFDWELSEEDHLKISQLPQYKRISIQVLLSDKDSGKSSELSDIDIVEE